MDTSFEELSRQLRAWLQNPEMHSVMAHAKGEQLLGSINAARLTPKGNNPQALSHLCREVNLLLALHYYEA